MAKKLNPDALVDLYEALKGLCPCQRPVRGGEIPFEWAISEKAMKKVRLALAKAESIVKAVNSYDAMKEALEITLENLGDGLANKNLSIKTMIKQALAKAES